MIEWRPPHLGSPTVHTARLRWRLSASPAHTEVEAVVIAASAFCIGYCITALGPLRAIVLQVIAGSGAAVFVAGFPVGALLRASHLLF